VLKEPVGPVAAFTPWNFPINQAVRKISAALATGCSIIVKAPEETPAAPAALIQAFVDAGVPAGVIGLVYGTPSQISEYLIPHPIIRKITFTGSTPVGKQLAALAGQHMKRATMELGGHAPVIVCEDADVELAVKAAGAAKFRNAGQVCISPTRFLVHESIQDAFVEAFAAYAKGLKVGDGLQAGMQMGPLANDRRLDAMQQLTQDAVAKGAKIATGGERIGTQGHFFAPTVLTHVPLNANVVNQEPFGPMAAVRSFSHLEDAIAEANRLPYGLAGYGFTRSLKNAHLLSQELQVGLARDAVRWRQRLRLRLRRRPRGLGGLPGHQVGVDHQLVTAKPSAAHRWQRIVSSPSTQSFVHAQVHPLTRLLLSYRLHDHGGDTQLRTELPGQADPLCHELHAWWPVGLPGPLGGRIHHHQHQASGGG
jgi:acyl-CoA reductase-like NAD-dependent aldehyde dehydrogenase